MLVLATALAGWAAWLLVEPWRDQRATRLRAGNAVHGGRTGDVQRVRERLVFGGARRRRQARARMQIVQALGALAAELDAGSPPLAALEAAAGAPPAWPTAAGAARAGGDVVAALRQDGERHEVLVHLAACWQVATDSGAGLARAVSALTTSARAAEDVRVQLEAELAGPRATARTLALLPLVGLAFGSMLGGDPVGWLVGTAVGRMCLVTGLALTGAGAWWTALIAKAVERRL